MKQLWVAALALSISSLSAVAQPKLVIVEGNKFDLGKIDRGVVATKRLTLKNVGNQKLDIGNVEVSCGCTGTVVSKKELKTGDTTSLLITFNSKNFNGPVHKTVTVNSNSEGSPRTLIEFTATVIEDLSFTPMQFYFKDAEVGRKSTATITVKNESNKELMITGYRSQLEDFVVKYPPKAIAPGESMQLTAEFTPRKAVPVLSSNVTITTSSQTQSEVYIYIFGNVKEFKFE